MPITRAWFQQDGLAPADAAEVARVRLLAREFADFMVSISDEIDRRHVWRAPSGVIQALLAPWLLARGFETELPDDLPEVANRSRPDFSRKDNDNGGILVEVERGGTTTNGHDLKDLWKCHLCAWTHHLFLVVPNSNVAEDGSPREGPFLRSAARLGTFFANPRTYVDVHSLVVLGYGSLPPERRRRSTPVASDFELP